MHDTEAKTTSHTTRRRRATQAWAVNSELFVQRAGLNPLPEAYANRGATSADLNGQVLHSIYLQIADHISGNAAHSFAAMIDDLPHLSAQLFLEMLYRLEVAGWRWDPSFLHQRSELASRSSEESSIMARQSQRNETHYIRSQFHERIRGRSSKIELEDFSW